MNILERAASSLLQQALTVSPVVVIMGARQTGKSTLVRNAQPLREHRYATLDDLDVAERAHRNPDDLVRSSPRMIIDEVQRAPALLHAIKRAVDDARPRQPGQFVLTGSANLLLMRQISESLAGRATYLPLWPLTRREQLGFASAGLWSVLFDHPAERWAEQLRERKLVPEDWRVLASRGGYPVPAVELEDEVARTIWFDGYVRTYLERDLQDLAAIDNLVDFRRVMRAVALRIGALVNQTEVSRDCQVPRPTVHRYMNLLEASYQLIRLESYSVNRTRRMIKSSKAFWSDTSLALHLSGEDPGGAHLENLVLSDLLVWRDSQIPRPDLYYWRTSTGLEIDFVIEHRNELVAIEVKSASTLSSRDDRALRTFRDDYGKRCRGALLLHTGDQTERLSERIVSTPWHHLM